MSAAIAGAAIAGAAIAANATLASKSFFIAAPRFPECDASPYNFGPVLAVTFRQRLHLIGEGTLDLT
jgi:hypothetical protein